MPASRHQGPLRRTKRLAGAIALSACLAGAVAAAPGATVPGAGHAAGAADAAGVAAATSADLAQFAADSPAMVKAELIAVEYWNVSPCGGQVGVSWAQLDPSINATSNWWNPVEAYGNAGANSQCTITFNQVQQFDWPMFCTVMVHEIGHLTGHQHVTDQASVMYPIYVKPIPQCQGTATGAPVAQAASAVAKKATPASAAKRRAAAHKAHSRHKSHKVKHTTKKHA